MSAKVRKNVKNSARQLHICNILAAHGISLEEFLSTIFYKDLEGKIYCIKKMFPTFCEDRINFVLRLYENKNIGQRIMGFEKSYFEAKKKHFDTFLEEKSLKIA